jgi:outer membrane protein, heavy metal efflux system
MHWMKAGFRKGLAPMALAALAFGCAGPLDGPREHGRSAAVGVDARSLWLEELRREERAYDARDGGARAAQQPGDDATLEELIAWARERHPAILAARAEYIAAYERIAPARTLPDPQLTYRLMFEQIDSSRDRGRPVGHSVGISQMFPWFGTLDLAAMVAAEDADAAAARLRARELAVIGGVRSAYAEYAYLAAAAGIVREHRDLLAHLESVVRSQYEVGRAPHRDFLRVQVETAMLETELRDAEDMLAPARARLNAAAGRHADAALPAPAALAEAAIELDDARLLQRLESENPELAAMRRATAARRTAIRLAQKRFYPDVMIGVEYGVNTAARMAGMDGGGEDTLGLMASINLPIWRSAYEAEVRMALAEFGASLRMFVDRRNELESELKMAAYGLRDARRRARLYGHELKIRAEQVLGATQAAYRAGEAGFTDLVEAQRELLAFELAHMRAMADAAQRLAEIETIVGGGGASQISAEHRGVE